MYSTLFGESRVSCRKPKLKQGDLREYRAKIISFYRQYNPSKVDDVNSIMQKWAGREELLIQALEKKYHGVGDRELGTSEATSVTPSQEQPPPPSQRSPSRRHSAAYRRSHSTPPTQRSPRVRSQHVPTEPDAGARSTQVVREDPDASLLRCVLLFLVVGAWLVGRTFKHSCA